MASYRDTLSLLSNYAADNPEIQAKKRMLEIEAENQKRFDSGQAPLKALGAALAAYLTGGIGGAMVGGASLPAAFSSLSAPTIASVLPAVNAGISSLSKPAQSWGESLAGGSSAGLTAPIENLAAIEKAKLSDIGKISDWFNRYQEVKPERGYSLGTARTVPGISLGQKKDYQQIQTEAGPRFVPPASKLPGADVDIPPPESFKFGGGAGIPGGYYAAKKGVTFKAPGKPSAGKVRAVRLSDFTQEEIDAARLTVGRSRWQKMAEQEKIPYVQAARSGGGVSPKGALPPMTIILTRPSDGAKVSVPLENIAKARAAGYK